ncbi:GspE/PulE family protein [Roseateles amylovorans]|uniref:GspE/PulE family protein n=1 Tax=Roseateles amylovorans TaxID=2978473 RepID=A0ABY6AUT1_9BURK|nr:GspE/PulE family protein [Roseateles amylovorans]UXH76063.1 GspE/PulE family protein [Roseateles amylovorans]
MTPSPLGPSVPHTSSPADAPNLSAVAASLEPATLPIELLQPLAAAELDAVRTAAAHRAVPGAIAPIELLAQRLQCPGREAAARLALSFRLPYLDSDAMAGHAPAFDLLPLTRAQKLRALLLRGPSAGAGAGADSLMLVTSDPFDGELQTQLEHLAGGPVRLALATAEDIHAFLNQQESRARAVDDLGVVGQSAEATGETLQVLSLATAAEGASPAVRLLNSTLYDALRAGASDVHLESTAKGLAVKYRIDGVLDEVTQITGTVLAEQAISRLKVVSQLDIAERRVPQDGSFRVLAQGREIDLRVSIMPSIHGQDAVIRILDKQRMIEAQGRLTLDALGFDGSSLVSLRRMMRAPHGMLLVTGPTGSGKTTTLYAALSEMHTGRDKVITIEDPVEYQLGGVLQIPVNDKKGLTFARGLRSILRHDPDIIMVGEIRDRETAEIAVQSALTGHMVLTTVHANSVFDVFGRFTHMGLDPYALVSALNGVWAQRLLRLNCPHCSRPTDPTDEELQSLTLSRDQVRDWRFMRGPGCGDCRGTGYRGRHAIAEILRLTDELRDMIIEKRPIGQIKRAAYAAGTRSLEAAGLDLVRDGRTTLEEVHRVTLAA